MIPQALIPLIGVLVVVFIAFYGFKSGGYLVHIGLMATPFLIYLVNNPSAWLVAILALIDSKLIFPGIPQGLNVVHVMMAGFVALIVARNIINKPESHPHDAADRFLIAFMVVLAVTAATRGLGIRALGGESWGGMGYIKLWLAGSFVLASRYVTLSNRQLRVSIILMVLLGLLPVFAQFLFMVSRGAVYQQYMFIEAYVGGLLDSLNAAESGRGVVRYHMLSGLSSTALMMGIVLIPGVTAMQRLGIGATVLGAFVMAGLSGFRGAILLLVGTVVLVLLIQSKSNKLPRLAGFFFLLFACLVITYPFIEHLPSSIQRTLSWLPGANVPLDIKIEAMNSVTTRTRVWEMAWAEVPRYLWIGKGFTLNPLDLLSVTVRQDWVLSAFLGHNYHSGPLTLLLDTGIFGFITGSGFMIASCISAYRRLRYVDSDPFLRRFYIFLLAQYIYSVPAYFFIFGDVRESFVTMFIRYAFMGVIVNSSIALKAAAQPKPARSSAVPAFQQRRAIVFR